MRIIHVITGLGGGGAERAAFNLVASSHGQEIEHVVVSLRDEGVYGERLKALGISVYALNILGPIPRVSALVSFVRLLRGLSPDIVQGWMYHGNLAASFGTKLSGLNSVVVWNVRHSLYHLNKEKCLSRFIIRANRWFSFFPKKIIYVSRISSQLHEAFGLNSQKTMVIPNGFNLNLLKIDSKIRNNIRIKYSYSKDELVIGHVARFHPMKNHVGFLKVAVLLASKYQHLRFLIVGKNVDLDNEILQGIIPKALLSRFIFTGERMDVYELMQCMDILCLSSSWGEAFPNVIGEAMALEVPCVVTDVGDSAYIVGNTGIVVPSANDDALFSGLQEMISKSEAERRELGRLARERIAENFSLDKIVEQYVQTYKGLVK